MTEAEIELVQARKVLQAAGLKPCSLCGEVKSIEEFWKCSANKDGLHSQYKSCIKEAHRIKYANDPDFAERAKVHAKDWKDSNPERDNQNRLNWQRNNLYRFREMKSRYAHNRRTRIYGGDLDRDITTEEVYLLFEGICCLCFLPCTRDQAETDHDIPLSRGGNHTWDNVQLACKSCNREKGNKTTEEFFS